MKSGEVDAIIEALKQTRERLRQGLQELFRHLFGPDGAEDPHAGVRVPKNRNPPGRAGTIALEEAQEDVRVEAVGRGPA